MSDGVVPRCTRASTSGWPRERRLGWQTGRGRAPLPGNRDEDEHDHGRVEDASWCRVAPLNDLGDGHAFLPFTQRAQAIRRARTRFVYKCALRGRAESSRADEVMERRPGHPGDLGAGGREFAGWHRPEWIERQRDRGFARPRLVVRKDLFVFRYFLPDAIDDRSGVER